LRPLGDFLTLGIRENYISSIIKFDKISFGLHTVWAGLSDGLFTNLKYQNVKKNLATLSVGSFLKRHRDIFSQNHLIFSCRTLKVKTMTLYKIYPEDLGSML
jgi:hypothetical protein